MMKTKQKMKKFNTGLYLLILGTKDFKISSKQYCLIKSNQIGRLQDNNKYSINNLLLKESFAKGFMGD